MERVVTNHNSLGIQNEINYIRSSGKIGKVFMPEGEYNIDRNIYLYRGIELEGEGYSIPRWTENFSSSAHKGTIWKVNNINIIPITFEGEFSKINKFAIWHQHDPIHSGWRPRDYNWTIRVLRGHSGWSDDCYIGDILLINATRGVYQDIESAEVFESGAIERLTIDGLKGQCLKEGIRIRWSPDVLRVRNIHLWPYWSSDDVVLDYTKSNATACMIERVDNPQFDNFFAINYNRGLVFDKNSHGSCARFQGGTIQIDGTRYGVVYEKGVIAGFHQYGVLCTQSGPMHGSIGVLIKSDGRDIRINSFTNEYSYFNALRIEGTNNTVSIGDATIRSWNLVGYPHKFPGLEACIGNKLHITTIKARGQLNDAPIVGWDGRTTVTKSL